jgi:leader peptidase (prepilin peptidase)/N-methyltransferase
LLGLVVGSFLNVCIDRLPSHHSLVTPPSSCDACGHRLTSLDLIPVVSYVFLRGHCRYCGAPIPIRSPLVELGTAFAFLLMWLTWHHL